MILLLRRLSNKLLKIQNWVLAATSILFVLSSATIMYMIEPETFETWFNSIYWVMTTMATVGYGDYYATSAAGKLFTIFIYIFGIGLLSLIIGKIIEGLGDVHRRRETGKLRYTGKGHVIIINWSKKAQYAIDELLSSDAKLEIVIIDESDRHPYVHSQVHFVNGDPTSEAALHQANIFEARSAILFADSKIDDASLVDGKSLLIASCIESIAPQVHTTVEVMLEKHVPTFRHTQVNDFILSHDAVSRLAVRSALNEGSVELFNQLLSRRHGADIYQVPVKPSWVTYKDAFHDLLMQGATLISDHGDMTINRKLDAPIPPQAKLFVVCDPDVHESIIKERRL